MRISIETFHQKLGALSTGVQLMFRRDGAEVDLIGMNAASETLVDKLAIHDKPGALDLYGSLQDGWPKRLSRRRGSC